MTYETYLAQIKERLHILHNEDDANLLRLLEEGHSIVQSLCGKFSMENVYGRSLVFDHVRFAYNGMSEHFYECFKASLSSFGWSLVGDGENEKG